MNFEKLEGPLPNSQKRWALEWTLQINFKVTTYFTCSFHLSSLSFNSTIPPKKTCNKVLIWVSIV